MGPSLSTIWQYNNFLMTKTCTRKVLILSRVRYYCGPLEVCKKARDINPDNALTWQNYRAVNAQLGRYDVAIVKVSA
ncbi:MAG: hypothetical protein LUQ50_03670 [Methanospirillum sp.]|uniref:hypothetical protein n=1 Tax=Methanospirillum sp. TaxID=45200 RepID=UPI002372665D|nr:hypothetical protein [Methanospirillum sp.]MDD1728152.1 hypothetical protein [Methanospirillum sp.]